MMFAIEEINRDDILLPNITLGYKMLDSCASPTNVLRAALTLVSMSEQNKSSSQCHPPPLSAIVAESGSTQSLVVAGMLGPFRVPVVKQTFKLFITGITKVKMYLNSYKDVVCV